MNRHAGGAGSPPGGSMAFPSTRATNGTNTGAASKREIDGLNDSAALGGVDLTAEESALRTAQTAQTHRAVNVPRQRVNLNAAHLQAAVVKIAASYSLKYLEPDTLPLLALAVQHRLRALLEIMVDARDHRASTSYLRPPPLYERPDLASEIAPMCDKVLYDDVGAILTAYDLVGRAEERKARIDRNNRETLERQEAVEREAAEAAMREAAAEAEGPKKKKVKTLNATQAAKALSENQAHELAQRTANKQIGGVLPAWAMGHVAPMKPTPSAPPTNGPNSPALSASTGKATNAEPAPGVLVPLPASLERARLPPDSLASPITWRDAVFAMERERGGGSSGGGGSRALHSRLLIHGSRPDAGH